MDAMIKGWFATLGTFVALVASEWIADSMGMVIVHLAAWFAFGAVGGMFRLGYNLHELSNDRSLDVAAMTEARQRFGKLAPLLVLFSGGAGIVMGALLGSVPALAALHPQVKAGVVATAGLMAHALIGGLDRLGKRWEDTGSIAEVRRRLAGDDDKRIED